MESLPRLWAFFWPQRQRLAVSLIAAMIAALLWAATLTLSFPIVKVLLHGKDLPTYIAEEIDQARQREAALNSTLAELDRQIEAQQNPAAGPDNAEYARLIREQSSTRTKLSTLSQSLARLVWVEHWIIPWLPVDPFAEFSLILLLLVAMTLLKGACEYVQETLVGRAVERALMQVRERLLRSTLKLDFQTLALEGTPQMMSRFTFDMNLLSQGLNLLGSKVVVEPLKAAACIVFAFTVNWRLTLLSLLCVPLVAYTLSALGKRLKKSSRKQMETMANLYQVLEETFNSFRIVQGFSNERLHRRRFHLANKAYFRRAWQILRVDAFGNPAMELLATAAVFLALAPGAYLVLRQKTSIFGVQLASTPLEVADLGLLYTLLAGVLDPVRKLSSVYSRLKKASTAAERIFQWMDQSSLVAVAEHSAPLPRHASEIVFERVRFHYAAADDQLRSRPPALENISLTIPFGSVVAVVGENGSGKSTLVQLLLRFFDPQEGRVLLDGVDLRSAGLRELRAQIGYVSQETQLFAGTIADNLRYGNPSARQEAVERAAELAHVMDFAGHLPQRLQTPVGQKGSRLSGGQRQRVALARAMLRDPSLMILDEATSAIDAKSEQLIFQSLREFSRNRTTFVITHRMTPELLSFVSLVVVLERGQLLACGSHDTLLRTCPAYQRLCKSGTLSHAA